MTAIHRYGLLSCLAGSKVSLQRESIRLNSADCVANDENDFVFGTVMPPFARKLAFSTYSIQSFEQINRWLGRCCSSHDVCNARVADSDFVPTRLIQICVDSETKQPTIRLLESKDLKEKPIKYVTLSHCWGSTMPLKLQKDNYNDFLVKIPLASLSRVFWESIHLLTFFREEFLWIDSLCIIQDSGEDWFKESKVMGAVYQHGAFNIAATGFGNRPEASNEAERAVSRLFTFRRPSFQVPMGLRIKDQVDGNPYDGDGNLTLRNDEYALFDADMLGNGIERAPLNTRGWVVQERALSPRTLHFGRDQIFWECGELRASEVFPLGHIKFATIPRVKAFAFEELYQLEEAFRLDQERRENIKNESTILDDPKDTSPFMTVFRPSLFAAQMFSKDSLEFVFPSEAPSKLRGMSPCMQRWSNIVENYTRSELTRESDKLVAVAGMASVLQQHIKCRYIAGLWNTDLEHQLLWNVTKARPSVRHEQTRGPSWSWASVDGPVSAARWEALPETPVPRNESVSWFAFVRDISAVPTSPELGELGPVRDGKLRMVGRLLAVRVQAVDKSQERTEGSFRCNIFWDTTELESQFGLSGEWDLVRIPQLQVANTVDAKTLKTEWDIFMIPVRVTEDMAEFDNMWNVYLKGLLIVPTGRCDGEFRRVGLVRVEYDLFTSVESTAIVDSRYFTSVKDKWCTVSII